MILTDDNFATIVAAVEYGRAIYDNLSKYIRFQMTALVAFIVAYLGAALFLIAGGEPFGALAVIWINFAQAPMAIALGIVILMALVLWRLIVLAMCLSQAVAIP